MNNVFKLCIFTTVVFTICSRALTAEIPKLSLTVSEKTLSEASSLSITLMITHPADILEKAQVFVALNSGDALLFYPRWTAWPRIGWETMDIASESTIEINDVPGFSLPDGIGDFCCISVFAALKHNFEIIGNPVHYRFGWTENKDGLTIIPQTVNPPVKRPVKGLVLMIMVSLFIVSIAGYAIRMVY